MWLALAEPSAPTRALAESVSVQAGTTCLEQTRLVEHVAQWLGRTEIDPRLSIEVGAGPDAATIVVREGETVSIERHITPMPADCADLHAAVGLAIALAIDASVLDTLGVPPPAPPVAPTRARDEEVPPPPTKPAPPPPPETTPLHAGAIVSALALVGAPTRASFGAELVGELGPARWIDLDVGVLVAGGLPVHLQGGRATPVLVAGRLAACPGRAFARRVRLRVCVGLDAGAIRAKGHDYDDPQTAVLPWLAARTGVDLDVRLVDRASLRIGLAAVAPLLRTQLVVLDAANEIVDRDAPTSVGGLFTIGTVLHGRSRW
jgi:hypothetical protein